MNAIVAFISSLLIMPYTLPVEVARQPPDRTYMYSDIDHVVSIEMLQGRCSGTVIAKGLVATAAHCVAKNELVTVFAEEWAEGEVFEAIFSGIPGGRWDVAILKGNTRDIVPAVLATSLDGPQGCFFFGYAGTEIEMMMPCYLHSDVGPIGILGVGEARPGDSGGGVFGANGLMIGITWGSNMVDETVVVPIQELHTALKELKL
jgi:S1-C subfamily serine protease